MNNVETGPTMPPKRALALVTLTPEEVADYLTAEEVAPLVKMSVADLTAAASTFQVPAVWCQVDGSDGPVPFFTVAFVRRIADIREDTEKSEYRMLVIPLFELIREYLKAYPPVATYDESLENEDAPILGRAGSRWGNLHVHVRAEALCTFAVEVGADLRLRTARTVTKVLRLMRAKDIAGARDSEGVRIARTLWRLPLTVANPNESEES